MELQLHLGTDFLVTATTGDTDTERDEYIDYCHLTKMTGFKFGRQPKPIYKSVQFNQIAGRCMQVLTSCSNYDLTNTSVWSRYTGAQISTHVHLQIFTTHNKH